MFLSVSSEYVCINLDFVFYVSPTPLETFHMITLLSALADTLCSAATGLPNIQTQSTVNEKDCCTHSLLHAQQDALTQYSYNNQQCCVSGICFS
jgi:hypothetical protein